MNYGLTELQDSPPADLLITVEAAKLHLYQDHDDQDGEIEAQIRAATRMAEQYTRRVFVARSFAMTLDDFPRAGQVWACPNDDGEVWPPRFGNLSRGTRFPEAIVLPLGPVLAVTGIQYASLDLDDDDQPTTQALDTYRVNMSATPGYLTPGYGQCWPCVARVPEAVRVEFMAGYGAAAQVPADIVAAVKLLLGDLFMLREDRALNGDTPNQRSALALLAPYRLFRT